MKTKREVLERFAEAGYCVNIDCNECAYKKICGTNQRLSIKGRLQKIGAMAILRMFRNRAYIAGAKEFEQKLADSNKNWNDLVSGWVADYREIEQENEQLKKENTELRERLEVTGKEWGKTETKRIIAESNVAELQKENEQLKQQLKNEKQLNAKIKKRLVEVEFDCEEFNHEYCDINCKEKRKELVDLYQLISDGLNETLLKQKEDEIKELKEVIKNLRCLENKG